MCKWYLTNDTHFTTTWNNETRGDKHNVHISICVYTGTGTYQVCRHNMSLSDNSFVFVN